MDQNHLKNDPIRWISSGPAKISVRLQDSVHVPCHPQHSGLRVDGTSYPKFGGLTHI